LFFLRGRKGEEINALAVRGMTRVGSAGTFQTLQLCSFGHVVIIVRLEKLHGE